MTRDWQGSTRPRTRNYCWSHSQKSWTLTTPSHPHPHPMPTMLPRLASGGRTGCMNRLQPCVLPSLTSVSPTLSRLITSDSIPAPVALSSTAPSPFTALTSPPSPPLPDIRISTPPYTSGTRPAPNPRASLLTFLRLPALRAPACTRYTLCRFAKGGFSYWNKIEVTAHTHRWAAVRCDTRHVHGSRLWAMGNPVWQLSCLSFTALCAGWQ